ncbi:MAG: Wzt carbohydrate-binding domain-containing protein [Verrucomicrobiae bacterium]|nr:Wzt carbohydrate-binding domain-containing protein [Verrucomicrobiae bacterium]
MSFDVENLPRKFTGSRDARILALRFNRTVPIFTTEEPFSFVAKVRASQNLSKIRFSMTIFAADGTPVGSCFSPESEGMSSGEIAETEIVLQAPRLAPGQYYCGVAIGKGNHRTGHVDYDVVLDTLHFEVKAEAGEHGVLASWSRGWGVIVFPDLARGGLRKMV